MATTKKAIQKASDLQATEQASQGKARMALLPSVNSAAVIAAYQGNIAGKDPDMPTLMNGLRDTFTEVKGNDLHMLEAMLISQATALQTIFTSLARRAANQDYLKQYEAYLGLALKAQAQSRATISALVDLKYPRQVAFVKQANIAHGPQQVNNGNDLAHAAKPQSQSNELLEDQSNGSTHMDIGTATAATRGDTTLGTVAAVYRPAKPRR